MTHVDIAGIARDPHTIALRTQMCTLHCQPILGASIVLTPKRKVVTIGRSHHSTIALIEKAVSAIHAAIFYEQGNWYLVDLGSTNGTQVLGSQGHFVTPTPSDGQRIPLKRGDTIVIAGRLKIPII